MSEQTSSSEDTLPQIADDENHTNGGDISSNETSAEEQFQEEEQEGGGQQHEEQLEDNQSEQDLPEELSLVQLPAVEPLVVNRLAPNRPRASGPPMSSLSEGGASHVFQRRIPVRIGISANATRSSSNHPDAKHLTIKLPGDRSNYPAGVWVAHRGDVVLLDFLPRNGQNDRSRHVPNDPWRWIKIKDSCEIAMAISRPYTKSRADGVLVRDYVEGAFTLVVPLDTPGTGASEPEPMAD